MSRTDGYMTDSKVYMSIKDAVTPPSIFRGPWRRVSSHSCTSSCSSGSTICCCTLQTSMPTPKLSTSFFGYSMSLPQTQREKIKTVPDECQMAWQEYLSRWCLSRSSSNQQLEINSVPDDSGTTTTIFLRHKLAERQLDRLWSASISTAEETRLCA